jgi:lipid-binding SYLF domain-containing protein
MKRLLFVLLLCSLWVTPPAFAANAKGVNMKPKTPQEWRTYLNYRREETLEDLYKIKPEAKDVLKRAHGYAVFVNFSMKIMLVGTGNGRGIVHDNKTGKDTYMRMLQAGAGFGFGVNDFRAIFVFDDRQVMDNFINSGWSFGGDVSAAAKNEEDGAATSGAIAVAPGVRVYQLTKNGLAATAMVNGTKYWIDADVNK